VYIFILFSHSFATKRDKHVYVKYTRRIFMAQDNTMEYSEKELADKAQIEKDTGLAGVLLEQIQQQFLDPEFMETGSISTVVPPIRCSDGKRRNFMDYIDYLFPDPPIETLIEQLARDDHPFIIVVKVMDSAIALRYRRKEATASM
jgi:hypothetical protein